MTCSYSFISLLCGRHSTNKLAIASHNETHAAIVNPCANTSVRTPSLDENYRDAAIASESNARPIPKSINDRLNIVSSALCSVSFKY